MPYSTAYVVTRQGLDLRLLVIPVVLVLAAMCAARFSKDTRVQAAGWLIVALGSFLGVLLLVAFVGDYLEHSWDYHRGHYEVVEGTVSNFHPMPYQGHDEESFSVSGVGFSYSDYIGDSSCFNRTASHGGPIREGLRVRVAYVDDCILRLDVAAQ